MLTILCILSVILGQEGGAETSPSLSGFIPVVVVSSEPCFVETYLGKAGKDGGPGYQHMAGDRQGTRQRAGQGAGGEGGYFQPRGQDTHFLSLTLSWTHAGERELVRLLSVMSLHSSLLCCWL